MITTRMIRFLLLLTTAWAAQWQQTPYNAPPVYDESTRMEQQPQQSAFHYSCSPSENNVLLASSRQVPPEPAAPQEPEIDPDIIKLEHVSLSLRLTCEMNRRLLHGIRNNPVVGGANSFSHTNHGNPLLQRGGDNHLVNAQHHPVNIHPSQSWQPPIRSTAPPLDQDELTVFHAKSPRPNRRGVARWGPDLKTFLEYVMGPLVLNIPLNQRSIVMALALVYLDRACSVETVRSQGEKKCPYCTPQTVHRLVLVALLTATRAVVGTLQEKEVVEKLGIPSIQLEQMQQVFLASLGDVGLYVDSMQLQRFLQIWHTKFQKNSGVPVRQPIAPMQPQWA